MTTTSILVEVPWPDEEGIETPSSNNEYSMSSHVEVPGPMKRALKLEDRRAGRRIFG